MAVSYPYVTEDNLNNPQHYDYSEFHGTEFFNIFYKSRQKFAEICTIESREEFLEKGEHLELNPTLKMLKKQFDTKVLKLLLKSFEIRKKIYHRYNYIEEELRLIPSLDSEYTNHDNYIFFAYLLCEAYAKSKNLIYLNALLKCNDIIASFTLTGERQNLAGYAIKRELEFVKLLADKNHQKVAW